MNAPVQTLRTSDGGVAPETARDTNAARHVPLLRVIAMASPYWLAAAGVTTVIALTASAHDRVPLGSGLAVALLTVAAVIDVYERRLPTSLVIAAAVVFTICVWIETAVTEMNVSSIDIAGGAAAFGGPLLLLHAISPASMGFGDVKTGIVLGAAIGVIDWQLALAGLALAAGLTATAGVLTRASTIAFGPGLIAASAIMLAAHPVLLAEADRPGGTELTTFAAVVSGPEDVAGPSD